MLLSGGAATQSSHREKIRSAPSVAMGETSSVIISGTSTARLARRIVLSCMQSMLTSHPIAVRTVACTSLAKSIVSSLLSGGSATMRLPAAVTRITRPKVGSSAMASESGRDSRLLSGVCGTRNPQARRRKMLSSSSSVARFALMARQILLWAVRNAMPSCSSVISRACAGAAWPVTDWRPSSRAPAAAKPGFVAMLPDYADSGPDE